MKQFLLGILITLFMAIPVSFAAGISATSSGDMQKSVYDTDDSGVVDDAEDVTCVGCVADVELATDFISESELDAEAELEAQLTDVTNVFTNNDGALTDDDVTAADVGAVSDNLDNTDASVEWEDANDLDANGDVVDDSHGHTNASITLASTDLSDTADLLYESELDAEAELESQLADVTNVFTNNDGALNDDDVTAADVGAVSDNLDNTDASVEWEDAGALDSDGNLSVDHITEAELDDESELEAQLTDVSNVFTDNDTIPEGNIHADVHRDSETKDGDLVSFDDADDNFTATDVDSALEELDDVDDAVNDGDGMVDWTNLESVPAGFADGTDDTGGGSAVVYDLGDDGADESSDLTELAIQNDTGSVWSEPSDDKALFDGTALLYESELDSESELETQIADMANIIQATEIDTEAELEALLGDVTNVFTDNDGALNDDDVTAADVGTVSANLDDADASVEWEDANDLDANGDVTDDSHNHVLANIDEISSGVGSEDMEAAEDFGDFTCDGTDGGCTIDANAVDPDDLSDEDQGDVNIDGDVWKVEEVQSGAISEAADIDNDIITHAQIADADQYDTKCIYFEDPTADDDFKSIWANKTSNDFIITEIWAESDQTVNFDLQIDDGSPADVNGTDISPAAGEAEDTSLGGDTELAAGEELDLAVTSVADTPTWCAICWTGHWED